MANLAQKLADNINVLYPTATVYQVDEVEERVYFELPNDTNDYQAALNVFTGYITVYKKVFDEAESNTWIQIERLTGEEFNERAGRKIFEMTEGI